MGQRLHVGLAPMTQDEKEFFKAMGTRIAELRKESTITQVQLAETMEVSQQTVAAWEAGRQGMPVSRCRRWPGPSVAAWSCWWAKSQDRPSADRCRSFSSRSSASANCRAPGSSSSSA